MKIKEEEIISYFEMCKILKVNSIQKGMNFDLKKDYSVILMSNNNINYKDIVKNDILFYQGHNKNKRECLKPNLEDQPLKTKNGSLTENGKFVNSIKNKEKRKVLVFDKIKPGIWSIKGIFELTGCEIKKDGYRNYFIFLLKKIRGDRNIRISNRKREDTLRIIPTEIKKRVYKRDKGTCRKCSSKTNLHFDHILPYSKGGTSNNIKNIQLLCQKCNSEKSNKIE